MKEITAEYICNEFHKQTFFQQHGKYPRAIKNFEKAKAKASWPFFVGFAKRCNDNLGTIDPHTFIYVLAEFYNGYFQPRLLLSRKSISLYKSYIDKINTTNDKEIIEQSFLISLKYILSYMKENNITDFDKYLYEDQFAIPTILRHYNSGNVSRFFMVAIPGIKIYIESIAPDIRMSFAPKFGEEYDSARPKVIMNPKLRKISDGLPKYINTIIKQMK